MLNMNKSIEFQVFSWYCDDSQSYPLCYENPFKIPAECIENFNFRVMMFGKTMNGKSVCIHVQNFNPSFYIRLPNRKFTLQNYESLRKMIISYYFIEEKEESTKKYVKKWKSHDDYMIDHIIDEEFEESIKIGTTLWGFTNFRKDTYM